MSVQSQIDRISQNVADTYATLEGAGADMPAVRNTDNLENTVASIIPSGTTTITANGTYDVTEYAAAEVRVVNNLQIKSITPGAAMKTVFPDSGYDALMYVDVEGDSDLVSGNIRKGVDIFGVVGTYEGIALNFAIQRFSSLETMLTMRPVTPNTIGIVSTKYSPTWFFSHEEPTHKYDGVLWIVVGDESVTKFNAISGNGSNTIQLCPVAVKQYVEGQFVGVTARIYMDGQWKPLWNGELYTPGNHYEAVTGGWVNIPMPRQSSGTTTAVPSMRETESGMAIYCENGGIVRTKNKIDLTNYSRLCFTGDLRTSGSRSDWMRLCIWSEMGTYWIDNIAVQLSSNNTDYGTQYIDLTGIDDGEYYIGFGIYASGCMMESLKLE